MDYLIRYSHFLGIMVLFASLVAMHLMTARSIGGKQARLLARLDMMYGLSAVIILISGVLIITGSGLGKGSAFYMKNGILHGKLTLFIVIVLLSIKQTMFFFRHRRAADDVTIDVPKAIIMLQRVQLLALFLMPFLGVLIANGVGLRAQ